MISAFGSSDVCSSINLVMKLGAYAKPCAVPMIIVVTVATAAVVTNHFVMVAVWFEDRARAAL